MIVPDVNLLVYAYNKGAPLHAASRQWWERLLNETVGVAVPWAVSMGFVRLMTHPGVLETPAKPEIAIGWVSSWFEQPQVQAISPGNRHLEILDDLLAAAGVGGNLTTDAHIAAIAIEYNCELHSNDSDFARFPGLKWLNPI